MCHIKYAFYVVLQIPFLHPDQMHGNADNTAMRVRQLYQDDLPSTYVPCIVMIVIIIVLTTSILLDSNLHVLQ